MRSDREVRFLFLPDGEDPDSVVRSEGPARLSERLDQAAPLSSFLFEELGAKLDLATPDGRARLVALAEPLLERLPPGPFAELMVQELQRRAGLFSATAARPASRKPASQGASERPLTPVQYAVAILVQHPELAVDTERQLLEVPAEVKGAGFLAQLIDFCRDKPNISTALILEHWRDAPEGPFLSGLATRNLAGQAEQLKPALHETLERIHAQMIRSRISELQQLQAATGLDQDRAAELREWLSRRATGRHDSR